MTALADAALASVTGVASAAAATVAGAAGGPTPAPSPPPAGGFEAWEVSPGLIGFVPVFLIALACVGLFLSLTRQMRRVAVRQAQQDADDAAAASAADGAVARPGTPARPGTQPPGSRGMPAGDDGPAGDGSPDRR